MREFPESVFIAYVDGELDTETEREFELFLMRSREARQKVVELQDESAVLRDALLERPRRVVRPADARAPARGVALGIGPALGVAVVATAVLGTAYEFELPSGIGWLSPLNLFGAYDMFFDFIFWLRDEAPQLLELLIAVAATAGLSALLTLAFTVAFRRLSGTRVALLGCAVAIGLTAGEARAVDLRLHQESVSIAGDETISEPLVFSGDLLYVDGVIDGDLALLADRAVIRGEVRGDVFAVARSLEVLGRIDGSLRTFSERVSIDGTIAGDVTGLVEELSLTADGIVERDLSGASEHLTVDGRVGRHLFAIVDRIELRGAVGGNADLRGERLEVLDGARVEGDLSSQLEDGYELSLAPGAVVGGEVTEAPFVKDFGKHDHWDGTHFVLHRIIILVSAFLVGMALYFFVPGLFGGRLETTPEFFRSLGIGALVLVGVPISVALSAATIVGIPIALIVAALYATALFVAFTVFGALLGRMLLRRDPDSTSGFLMTLFVGLAVLGAAISLPWIGPPLGWLAMLTGLGLVVDFAIRSWWAPRRSQPAY